MVEALTTEKAGSLGFKTALAAAPASVLRHVLVYRRLTKPAQRAVLKRLLDIRTTLIP